jgi:putative restriction endonuclease
VVRVSAEAQIERLIEGLTDARFIVLTVSDPAARPVLLEVSDGTRSIQFRVFCWNVTGGGTGRSQTEYRVQATRPGDVPLHLPEGPPTLLLGYFEELDVFAAWDATKHPLPSASPSLQIPITTLEAGASEGFAANDRAIEGGEREVVVAFRPELIGTYLEVAPVVEDASGEDADATAVAASGEQPDLEDVPEEERRRALVTASIAVRDGRFRLRVLDAYERRCAFCDLGATLVEAAHIRPVYQGGSDAVTNGVAACPTHHLAFDRGLLLLGDDYAVTVNAERLRELGGTTDDEAALAAGLRGHLRLPARSTARPALENVAAHRAQWLG